MRSHYLFATALLAATGLAASARPPAPKQDDAKSKKQAPIVMPLLMAEPGIQKMLDLTDDQRKAMGEAARKFGKEQDDKMTARFAKLQGGQGGIVVGGIAAAPVPIGAPQPDMSAAELKMRLQMPESQSLVKTIVEKVLKPEQARRLGELDLQAQGPAALLDRRVIRALNLTEDQEERIDDVKGELEKKRTELNDDLGFKPADQEHWKKLETAHTEAMKKCLDQLSDGQRKAWAAKTGAPAPLDQILRGSSRNGNGFATATFMAAPAMRIAPAAPLAPPPAP